MQRRKGFTLVELVVVIAVIAILAGVLIGTFASVINKANESANVQKLKQQEIEQKATDILKKLEESNWLGWEDFEAKLVAELTKVYTDTNKSNELTSDDVKKAVNDAFTTYMAAHQTETTQLTEEQVKAIIENALGTIDFSGVTEAQVKAIINAATTAIPTSSQIKAIVEAANAKNLTANDVAKIVAENHDKTITEIQTAITSATANLATSEQAEEILNYLSSADSSSVILAKALNINISQKGITTASSPYEVVSALGGDGTVNDLPKTVLLDLVDGAPAFFVVDDDKNVVYDAAKANLPDNLTDNTYNYWTFASDVSSVYSTYLTAVPTTVAPNGVGLDVGNQTIASINYTDTVSDADATKSRSVVIRTNGGTLTIDAEQDDIAHYGYADSVNIVAVAPDTYRENGKVGFTQIAKGHYVAEAGAEVLVVLATGSADDVTIDNNGATIDKAYTTDATSQNTLHGGNESLAYYEVTPTGTQTPEEALAETIENLETGATLFAGGTGSLEDPFLIKTTEHIQNISKFYQHLHIVKNGKNNDYSEYEAYKYEDTNVYIFEQPSTKGFYYKVADGVTQLDCSNWTPVDLYGSFDGNNCKFINLDQTFFDCALNYYNYGSDDSEWCEISNCDFEVQVIKTSYATPIVFSAGPKLRFTNVNVSGKVEGSYISSYVGFGVGQFAWNTDGWNPVIPASYEFVNCKSTATLTCVSIGEGGAAGFFAHIYSDAGSTVNLINSTYEGRMNVFAANKGYYINTMGSATVTMDEVSASKLKSGTTNQYAEANVHIIAGNKNGTVSGYNVITENAVGNASYAIATYMIGTNPGGIQGAYITERIELDGNTFTSVNAHRYDVVIDKTDSYFYKIDGNTIKLGRPDCTGINTNYIIFNQYDSSGNLLSSVMYAFGSTSTIQE